MLGNVLTNKLMSPKLLIQGRKVGVTQGLVNISKGSYQVFLGRGDLNYCYLLIFNFSDVT